MPEKKKQERTQNEKVDNGAGFEFFGIKSAPS